MAQELTITGSISFAKGAVLAIARAKTAAKFTVTGTKYAAGVMTVPITTADPIPQGEVGTPGWFFLLNLGTTSFITIREGVSGADVLKLKAGEFAVGRFAGAAPHAVADTAPVTMEYLIVED